MHAWMERKNLRSSVRSGGRLARSLVLSAAVATLGLASTAFAGFTTIQTPLGGNESQTGLLDGIYGGTFTLEDGVDYSNGTLTAVRVSDTLPNTSTLSYTNPGPNATDQTWQGSFLQATVKYSHAADPSTPFGYIPGASGGTFSPLFSVTGSGFGVTGTGSFSPTGTFRLGAQNTYGLLSSLPSDNVDNGGGKDHMVTYQIDGLGGSDNTWLVAFTDYGNAGVGSSEDAYYDYQNLVVQLQTLPASSTPEPGSMMLIGGVAVALLKRVPRRAV